MRGHFALFAAPCWVFGVAAANSGAWPFAGILALVGLVLVQGHRAVVFLLSFALFLWLGTVIVLAQRLALDWAWSLVGVMTLVAVAAVTAWAIWLRRRYALWSGRIPRTREWQWVYTGFGFVSAHPLYARLGAVWLVILWVAAQALVTGFYLVDAWMRFSPPWYLLFLPLLVALLYALALLTLLARAPAAYPLTWVVLLLGVPFSLPIALYWADGTRPNLIYRHRFERLIPPGNARWNLRDGS